MFKEKIGRRRGISRALASIKNSRNAAEKPYEPEVIYATLLPGTIVDEDMENHMQPKPAYTPAVMASLSQLFSFYERAWKDGTLGEGSSKDAHRHFAEKLTDLHSNVAAMKADPTSKEQARANALQMGS